MTAVNMSSSHNASARLELRRREHGLPFGSATCPYGAKACEPDAGERRYYGTVTAR